MNKITFAFFLLLSTSAFSQNYEKGDWMAGATTGVIGGLSAANYYGTEEDFKLSISLSPEIGKMITDRTSIGSQFGFGLETDFASSVLVLGATPFIRSYYKKGQRFSSFFEASAGLFMVNATPFTDFGTLASIRFGVDYFVMENVTVGARFGPTHTYFNDRHNIDLGLRFGMLFVF